MYIQEKSCKDGTYKTAYAGFYGKTETKYRGSKFNKDLGGIRARGVLR